MEKINVVNAKCNFQILINVEKLRILLDERAGKTKKVENHKNHLHFLLEILEVFEYMDRSNQSLYERNAELSYANMKLMHENDKLKKLNNNLMQGI
jgi:hypothetical protein